MCPSRAPHQTVFPVARRKPAASIASSTPMVASSLRVLGGIDSAAPRAGSDARARISTECPHSASRRAAADPAGPPPITTASKEADIGATLPSCQKTCCFTAEIAKTAEKNLGLLSDLCVLCGKTTGLLTVFSSAVIRHRLYG